MTAHSIWVLLLAFTAASFLFGRWLDWLNDRAKSPLLPAQAEGIYNEERYAKWLAYDKANSRVRELSGSISIVLSMVLLYAEYFGRFDIWLREFVSYEPMVSITYFAIVGVASWLLGLPFDLYSTFGIEVKFGFNKTTVRTYILDLLKGAALSVLIGFPLMWVILWLYDTLGASFWLYAWLVVSGFSLFMAVLGAHWLMPLFNKFTPLEDGPLRSAIEAYCQKVNFPVKDLYIMDGSRRSTKSNAFFMGLGPKKKIVLFDTLVAQMEVDEIVAILAHEVGHYKHKHIAQSTVVGVLETGVSLYILGLVLQYPELSAALGAAQPSFHIGIIAFGILLSPLSTLTGIFGNMWSRHNEFQADAFAKATSDGDALVSALKKLTSENLSNLKPHPFYAFVHYSHPPVLKRIEALRNK